MLVKCFNMIDKLKVFFSKCITNILFLNNDVGVCDVNVMVLRSCGESTLPPSGYYYYYISSHINHYHIFRLKLLLTSYSYVKYIE